MMHLDTRSAMWQFPFAFTLLASLEGISLHLYNQCDVRVSNTYISLCTVQNHLTEAAEVEAPTAAAPNRHKEEKGGSIRPPKSIVGGAAVAAASGAEQ